VRAGVRDCPQDNPLSKEERTFNSRLIFALFLYVVVARFIYPFETTYFFLLQVA
jgi:hypothetical protein